MGDESAWALLPPDVLALVITLIPPHDTGSLMRTCSQWNRSIKSQLMHIDLLYLARPWKFNFSSARTASMPLAHVKHGGFSHFLAPARRISTPVREVLPNLTALDVCGQSLSPDFIASLPTKLRSLTLSCCYLAVSDLQLALPQLQGLSHLDLAGLRAPDMGGMLASFLPTLCAMPSLSSLDISKAPSQYKRAGYARVGEVLKWRHLDASEAWGQAGQVLHMLPSLSHLRFLGHPLNQKGLESLSQCSRLRSLALSCFLISQGGMEAWDKMLQDLAQLTSIHLELPVGGLQLSSISPLTQLKSLQLPNCHNIKLALSCSSLTRLTKLDLSYSLSPVTPELVVQVCSSLPRLRHLDVSNSIWDRHFQLPGDILMRGLSFGCRQLQTLRMNGVYMHGTGFSLPGAPPSAALPELQELVVYAGMLLKCKLRDVAMHTELRKLILTGVNTEVFNATAKVNGYMELTRLVHLTQLIVLGRHALDSGLPDGLPPGANEVQGAGGVPAAAPAHNAQIGGWNAAAQEWDPANMAIDESDDEDDEHHIPAPVPPPPPPYGDDNPPMALEHVDPDGAIMAEWNMVLSMEQDYHREKVLNFREPHLHFLSALSGLQVLVLQSIESTGVCFQHILGLSKLRVLHLGGAFYFTRRSVEILKKARMPNLQSLRLATCNWAHLALPIMPPGPRDPPLMTAAEQAMLSVSINDVVDALSVAMPAMEHLDLGDCGTLLQRALRVLGSMRTLRYLVLHRNPLSESECQTALAKVNSPLIFFASSTNSSADLALWLPPMGVFLGMRDTETDGAHETSSKAALDYILSDPTAALHFATSGGFMLARHTGQLRNIREGKAGKVEVSPRALIHVQER